MKIIRLAVVMISMILLLVLQWIRPVVRWPLLLLSGASLFVLAATLIIPYPVPVRNQLLMATVGTGALALAHLYDATLCILGGLGRAWGEVK